MKQLIVAAVPTTGNFVGVQVQCITDLKSITDQFGDLADDMHVTLMYSKGTSIDTDDVFTVVPRDAFLSVDPASTVGYALFGDDDDVKAVVCLLNDKNLQSAHNKIKSLGMEHSYPEYSPHVTLYYDVPNEEAERMVQELKKFTPQFKFDLVESNPINEDWGN